MGNIKKILVLGLVALWLMGAFAVTATAEYDPISPAPNSPTDEEQNVIEDLDSIFSDTEQEDVEYLETLTPEEEQDVIENGVVDPTEDTTPSETIVTTTVTTTATTTTTTTTGADEAGPKVPLPSMFFFSAVALIIFIAGGVVIYVITKRQVNLRQH